MKEITDTLTVFFNIFRNDLKEYYEKSYSYLKDLIVYKKINLNQKIEIENERSVKNNLVNMLKAIKTGLNTLGISIDQLNESQDKYLEYIDNKSELASDYNYYFEEYLNNYVNKLLIEILIEYLLDLDFKKLENVNLFDLLPPYFISKLNEFKRSHFGNINIINMFKQQNYYDYINFVDLTINKPKKVPETDILKELREAKEGFIETLKIPKKELLKPSIEALQQISVSEEKISQIDDKKVLPPLDQRFNILLNTGTFIDYFGHFNPIHPNIISKFDIDKLSLINSKVVNREYFDLECLFYYISILKMLNLEVPFTNEEIAEIMKDFINGWVFSSSKDNAPDVINNFYGLVIFFELDLINKTDIIDLQEIENFIRSEFDNLVLEKLTINLHSLLCLRLITMGQKKAIKMNLDLESISNLSILGIDNFKPTIDIFNHLVTLRLLGKEAIIDTVKRTYITEIKKLIISNGSVNDLITESARALLILHLLNLKDNEVELCRNLLNFITSITSFFFIENVHKDFNWRSDRLGFKIELEMLYWALLASSQFSMMV